MAVPGSSPVVVIDADEDSGFTASVDSKLANEYYLYMLVLKIISSWPPERLWVVFLFIMKYSFVALPENYWD